MKKILSGFLILFSVVSAFSQGEFTMNYMEQVYQSTYINPSASPDHKFSLGLPGISSLYFGLANTGFTINDLRKKGLNGVDSLDFSLLKSKISGASNFIYVGNNIDLFHMRVKVRRTFISFNVSNKSNYYFAYPQDFGRFVNLDNVTSTKGGTDYEGKSYDLSGLGINYTTYNEYALGFATIQKKFIFAGRFKYLQGIFNMNFNADKFIVDVDKTTYDITYGQKAQLNTSGPIDTSLKFSSDGLRDGLTGFKNTGFATDLGVSYMFRKNLIFSINANNIGFITWRNNATQFETSGDIIFKGVNVLPSLLNGSSLPGVAFVDSLGEQVKPKATAIGAYTTWLIPQTYLNVKYFITPRLMLGGTFMMDYYKVIRPGISIGGQYKLGRICAFTLSANYMYSIFNVGAGFVFSPGPVQLYIATDNIAAFEAAYKSVENNFNKIYAPTDSKMSNIRVGMNLVFGKIQLNQKQAFNK